MNEEQKEKVYFTLLAVFLIFWVVANIMAITVSASLQTDIRDLPYETTQIRYNGFDCSDTSAITQNELSKQGWDARILVLTRPDKRNHAMVIVYDNTNYTCTFIECTQKRIVSSTPSGYSAIHEYRDVIDAVHNSGYGVYEWGFDTYIEQLERKGEKQ